MNNKQEMLTEKRPGDGRAAADKGAAPQDRAKEARPQSPAGFLPVSREEIQELGWRQPDFVIVSGDAYVDHPSFGVAIIGRLLESQGFKVAMLAQPDAANHQDFRRFGRPKYAFLVSAGNIDSMVAHYTAAKKRRSDDAYTPGNKAGRRPDRAVTVYTRMLKQAYPGCPVIIGGIEASLRRFAHYDYWSNKVHPSVLTECGADLLVFGMGERQIEEIARRFQAGLDISACRDIPGVCYGLSAGEIEEAAGPDRADGAEAGAESGAGAAGAAAAGQGRAREGKTLPAGLGRLLPEKYLLCPSFQQVSEDKRAYCEAARRQQEEQDAVRGRAIVQEQRSGVYLVQNPPAAPLEQEELDAVFALPFARMYHPMYEAEGGVKAIEEVEFSLMHNRGCYGGCNFCAITLHQGRQVRARGRASVLAEAETFLTNPRFKGYIHDVGGPTANFRGPSCKKQLTSGVCENRLCLSPKPCPNLIVDHSDYFRLLRELRRLPGVKKVFVRSGIRYDYLLLDRKGDFLEELCRHHVSGQLKVAPEHCSDRVLALMGKPSVKIFEEFAKKFAQASKRAGLEQYLVPYLMSSHPGATTGDALEMALFLKRRNLRPEQVQDFYPTPGTISTAMFYTGLDPYTLKPVYVPKAMGEKRLQRLLLQYYKPENHEEIRRALIKMGRRDLIGFGPACLVPPERRGAGAGQAPAGAGRRRDGRPAAGKGGGGAFGQAAGKQKGGAKGKGAASAKAGPGASAARPAKGAATKKEKASRGWAVAKPKKEKKKSGGRRS